MANDLGEFKRAECNQKPDGDWSCVLKGLDGTEQVTVDRFSFNGAENVGNFSMKNDLVAHFPGECEYQMGAGGDTLTCSG
jgi:hypothetical protein